MIKYKLILFLLVAFLFSFDVDQWTYLKHMGSIHYIVEDDQLVHFISSNGIYSYDEIKDSYYYNFNLSHQIDFNSKINHFYFDSNTGMYWLIDQYGIKMKHSFHDFWSEVSYRRFDIIDTGDIINIGSSPNYIWIKLYHRMIALDPITGLIIDEDIDYNEINNINWGNKNEYNYHQDINIDLSNYVIFGDWNIRFNKIVNDKEEVLYPTVFFEDANGNIWVGTDKGVILKGSVYSHRLEIVNIGLKFKNITMAVLDRNMNWWFGDSQFLRTGIAKNKQNFTNNNLPFLVKWNEYQNDWNYINSNASMLIQNTDVNDILSIDNIIYIGTMDGLLIFDQLSNDWMKIDIDLYDKAIWDLEYYEGSIYISTARGYNEISSISRQIIENKDNLSNMLRNSEIYDILVVDNILYVASEKGLFQKHLDIDSYTLLSDKKFKDIELYEKYIFGSDGDLWKINLENFKIENFKPDVLNFSISGNLLWLNHSSYCRLFNINTNNSWTFDNRTGIPGSRVYNINSNNEKVWFMTNDGLAIYNWDNSDYE